MNTTSSTCYWVLAGDDSNGVLVLSRSELQAYIKTLSREDRQGMQIAPFDLECLDGVLRATEARILVFA